MGGTSQEFPATEIGLKSGEYAIVYVLDHIKNQVENIAFSASRLSAVQVKVNEREKINRFLERLQKAKIISIEKKQNNMVITPYTPEIFAINGLVKDQTSGEYVIGATVRAINTQFGVLTNNYGYFSLSLPEGSHTLEIRHVGFQDHQLELDLKSNIRVDILLAEENRMLSDIEIRPIPWDYNSHSATYSIKSLNIDPKINPIPYFLGEVDVLQKVILQPGVHTIGEDINGINVRGGRTDQNLFLLDEVPIYNPNHFNGIISIFNPEAINEFTLLKGYMAPKYGGRVSSVLQVRQNEGNSNKLRFSGGLGIISARGLLEGPLKKEKSSFLISARQSLLNLSLTDFGSNSLRRNRMRFRDINMKVNFRPNDKNTFFISSYYGVDSNTVGLSTQSNWGNTMGTIKWNRIIGSRFFSNTSLFVSSYNYETEDEEEPGAFIETSTITNYGLKSDMVFSANPQSEFGAGFSYIYHHLNPGRREPTKGSTNTNTIELDSENGLETAYYLSHEFRLNPLTLNYGVRLSMLNYLGPGSERIYKENIFSDTYVIDTPQFSAFESISRKHVWEPRFELSINIFTNTALRLTYARNSQYIHLISSNIIPSPTDIWKLSDLHIDPTISDYYSGGIYHHFFENKWSSSVETYYRDIQNNIQLKDGANLIFNENIETELLLTDSRAYGVEFEIMKNRGRLKGEINYTLSRSEYLFESAEGLEKYIPENFDRTHSFSTSWNYNVSDRVNISANFVYLTGIPVTLPTDKFQFAGNIIPYFNERNNGRIPDYHRLDISLKWSWKKGRKKRKKRRYEDYFMLSLYNAYARRNTYSYFYRTSRDNPNLEEIVKYSVFFTIFPSITYNFKF